MKSLNLEISQNYFPSESELGAPRDFSFATVEHNFGVLCSEFPDVPAAAENTLDYLQDHLQKLPLYVDKPDVVRDDVRKLLNNAHDRVAAQGGIVSAAVVKFVGSPKFTETITGYSGNNRVEVISDGERMFSTHLNDSGADITSHYSHVATWEDFHNLSEDNQTIYRRRHKPPNALGNFAHIDCTRQLLFPDDQVILASSTVFTNLYPVEVAGAFRKPATDQGLQLAQFAKRRQRETGHVRAVPGDITVIRFKVLSKAS